METVDIYWYEPEKVLGNEEYREQVYDFEIDYTVDEYDIGKYDGKWYLLSANGCSCWEGEGDATGPFGSLDELREWFNGEYGVQVSNYYEPFVTAFNEAVDKAASAV